MECSFQGLWEQMTTLWAENSSNVFSHSSGGQKSEIRVLAGSAPSEGSQETPSRASSWILLVASSPWLAGTLLSSASSVMRPSPLCLSASSKDTSHSVQGHPTPV